jgi:glycosyltransferase involved in cell wall biosynthesis
LSDLPASEVQLVFVDDGSSDDSLSFIESFAAARSNTLVHSRAFNGGVGRAVNDALELCRGEWLQRCDSDDEIVADGIMAAYRQACKNDYDLVMQPFVRIEIDGRSSSKDPEPVAENETPLQRFWRNGSPTTCNCMVRNRIIRDHQIRVPEGLPVGEDRIWMLSFTAFLHRDKVASTSILSYRYHIRSGSISHQRLAEKAHLKLMLLDAMLLLGEKFVRTGQLDQEFMVKYLWDGSAASAVRGLVKARCYGQALAEYQRLKMRFGPLVGTSQRMRRQFWRAFLPGIWKLLVP